VLKKIYILAAFILFLALPYTASAEDILCDPAHADCRARILTLIRNEQVGIDVAFWFMEDARYTNELILRHRAGVPVRVLVDTRANSSTPLNADRLQELADAGIPMRRRSASGILHWKMMLFDGQNTVQFSAANYSPWAFVPVQPYLNYVDEVIYYTDDSVVTNSFRTKFDDLWTNTSQYSNYANISEALARRHGIFTKDPELNFPPLESYRSRAVRRYDAETTAIDVIMYRITDRAHADAMIRAVQRGVPVRLITEPKQYRDETRLWHSWNVDRMYMAGVQLRHRAHLGLLHQKSVLLRSQALTIFGSSNWTSPSSDSQEEHNYFTYKPDFYQWFSDQFDRKWNNTTGNVETEPFVPLPPDRPAYVSPANALSGQGTSSVTLTWNGGAWAHLYDVYFGTTPEPPLFAPDQPLGPSNNSSDNKRFTITGLLPGTTYYWRIVGKTMANMTAAGPIYSFTTAGDAPPPPPSSALGPGDILLYASKGTAAGSWSAVSDGQAAGGARMYNTDAGLAKASTASPTPADYFEMTFTAEAGKPYRLWLRARALNNHYSNDSVHVQFSGSVTSGGSATWRIGTSSSTEVNLEDGSGAGLSGWGWQDNGWGVGVLGPLVYFQSSGPQTIRVQRREDGVSIDQILLSPEKFLSTSPGALKNDTTILPESDGTGTPPPPPPPPPTSSDGEVVLYASQAAITGSDWVLVADPIAAGGGAIYNPDLGRAKVTTAQPSPASYIELTFNATSATPYHLWIRGRAHNDYWGNDSVHVQFSGAVDTSGSAVYRIGSSDSATVNLEDGSGAGLSNWGWQDTGYGVGVMGPLVYFATTGPQTIRIQTREDGIYIDQIVLSSAAFVNASPGALKNDTTILPESGSGGGDPEPDPEPLPEGDLVLYASTGVNSGAWAPVADATAAGGSAMRRADAGGAKITTALAAPTDYFDLQFTPDADTPYRLWIRARAENDYWGNDSVHVQFSHSVATDGTPVYRIGTNDSTVVNLEDASGAGLSGWGWQDNGYGAGVLGPVVQFVLADAQTLRIQTREDGLTIDQVVLSPVTYMTQAPGELKNDTTILAETGS
jgi:phosphatidylserine/phosphatidylglycerophosphate/cardiolipin synthase-like enzyme